ncbi:hypothetical protein Pelo_10368 [Pelomyxa schiedti]|nr:hypothetical protein Pelo_10368 [Pelomyxa schiedti]
MQGAATRREVGAFLACFEVVSVIGSQESDQATYHVTRVATVPGLPEMPVSLVMKVIFNYTDQTSRMCPFEYEEWVLYHLPPSSLLLPFHGSFCDVLDERSISHCFMPNMRTDLNLESSNVPPESEKQTEATEPLDNKNTASSDETTTSDIRPFIGTPFEALSQRGFIPPSILSQAINGGVPVKCFLYSFLNSLSDTQYQGMPAGHLIDFIVKMLQCLHFLHTNFVFHTTLRPNSFFVTPDSTLQIGGFDRADVLTVNSVESGPRTATSLAVPCSLCGIVHPSQCSSSSLSDQATLSKIDLWSVGTIVFYLVLGRQYTQEDRHLPLSETIPSTYFPEPAHLLEKLLNKDINMRPTVLATLIDLGIKEAPPLDISRCTPCTAERLTTEAIATLHTPQARVLLEESLRLDETFIPAILALRAMRLYFPRNFNWPSADAVFKDHTGMLNRRAQNAPQEAQKQAEHFFSRESSSLAWFVIKASWLRNVRHNSAEAANVASIAASRGYAPAQAWLGVCYEHGSGVKKDIEEAARLYQCAADQNLAQGQCWLGVCYENGRGVEKVLLVSFSFFFSQGVECK